MQKVELEKKNKGGNMKFFHKLKGTYNIFKHREQYVNGATYYPDSARKSRIEILMDHLYILWKYGVEEPFYYSYGFDRKEMTRKRMNTEYLMPYSVFQKRVDGLNTINPKYGIFQARVITADKFYFNIFLKSFGIPTPEIYLYIKDKVPMYVSPTFGVDQSLSPEGQLRQLFSHDMDAFAKPNVGQLGIGAFKLEIKNGVIYVDHKETSMDELIEIITADEDYLVQECVYQHPKLNELNPSCINSIRLPTLIDKDGKVIPFGVCIRIGRNGSSVDNWAKGGVLVGIDIATGKLMETGYLKPKYGTVIKKHPDTHVTFKDFEIPYFKEAVEMAVRLHKHLYRCHSVGWDIAITDKGPVFIEGNGWWEISARQTIHGGLKKTIGKYFE